MAIDDIRFANDVNELIFDKILIGAMPITTRNTDTVDCSGNPVPFPSLVSGGININSYYVLLLNFNDDCAVKLNSPSNVLLECLFDSTDEAVTKAEILL